ncbi:MAG: calcium/sodium antiporter [Ignavibacteria bacterium]|nr:calcium/sodium antiporter [Ignavibacteria bacterium]
MTIFLFLLGLAFLIVGAEALVKGASRMASSFGVSPLVIGLTVVAFGTSSPELAVSVEAALSGQGGIVAGNVVGSNIFNVLFTLGLSAVVAPLVVSVQLVRFDVPLMILLSLLVLLLSVDGSIGRIDGLVLVICLVVYVIFLFRQSRGEHLSARDEDGPEKGRNGETKDSWMMNALLVIAGLSMLVVGSGWLVDGAVILAQRLGVSELIIGLTIVAAGTSLPEVVTSIVAVVRGERDIAVGNVVGSNMFNIMCVLGISGVIAPGGIALPEAAIGFDIPVMIAVAFACLPVFFTGGVISRLEGVFLLGYYAAYTLYLLLDAAQHDALPRLNQVMLYFVIPLTVITMIIVSVQELVGRKGGRSA